jgi:hypothetical protein
MPDLFPVERCPHCGQPISALDYEPDGSIGCNTKKDLSLNAFTFPTVGKVKTWYLSVSQFHELAAAFPHLDILGQCRKALAWLGCNRVRMKTARGMPKFLFHWLSNAQDRSGRDGKPDNGQLAAEARKREREANVQAVKAEAQKPALAPAEVKAALADLRAKVAGGMKMPIADRDGACM